MSANESIDDQHIGHDDDDERYKTDDDKRQPRADTVLEEPVRLRTTADADQATGQWVVLEVTCPEDVEVLGDGGDQNGTGNESCASRNADDVFPERTTDSNQSINGEDHEDPDGAVADRVEREFLHFTCPSDNHVANTIN